jgi:hypothetical protein
MSRREQRYHGRHDDRVAAGLLEERISESMAVSLAGSMRLRIVDRLREFWNLQAPCVAPQDHEDDQAKQHTKRTEV